MTAATRPYTMQRIGRVTPQTPLTPRQSAVLAYLREEVAAGRGFPLHPQIGSRFGWRGFSVTDVLGALLDRGLVERDGWRKEGSRRYPQWRLTERGKGP